LRNITSENLSEELLKQLAAQVNHAPVAVLVSMALIAYMASAYVSIPLLLIWIALVAGAQCLRWTVFRQLPLRQHIPVEKRMWVAVAINTGNTLLHSLSLSWFPLFTPYQGAVQSVLIVGMGVGSILTTAGLPPFTIAHIFLGLIPLFGLWTWSGFFGAGGDTAVVLALIGFGYSLTLYSIAGRIFALYSDSFEARRQMEVALNLAEAAGRAKTRFLASASHDLRQPIHALSLFSAALGMRNLDDRSSQIVTSIQTSVEALSRELDGLLDISKLDAGIVTVRRTHFCLASLLLRMRQEFFAVAYTRGIDIILECPERAMAHTDSALLERVLRNLISNAIHHNQQCTLTLRIVSVARGWQLIVMDSGCGIDPAEQHNIFEEFYQLENPERDRSKGLGLGLAIVRRLSDLLDIHMEFVSAPGVGTQFKFTLPASDAETQPGEAIAAVNRSIASLVVLVVDDETTVRDGMQTLLESFGCIVSTADSSESAISAATAKKPDIALVDYRLREQDDGLLLIERLRRLFPGLPTIIVSGDTAPDRLLEVNKAGIPVLTKPVLSDSLKEAIIRSCL
jgi:signal transduction histidine kinase